MAIKITLSNLVKFDVVGTTNSENGPEPFKFSLVGNRYSQNDLKDRVSQTDETQEAFLLKEISNWTGVKDDKGSDVPYSVESFKQLLQIVGMTSNCFNTYLQEMGSKAKN